MEGRERKGRERDERVRKVRKGKETHRDWKKKGGLKGERENGEGNRNRETQRNRWGGRKGAERKGETKRNRKRGRNVERNKDED